MPAGARGPSVRSHSASWWQACCSTHAPTSSISGEFSITGRNSAAVSSPFEGGATAGVPRPRTASVSPSGSRGRRRSAGSGARTPPRARLAGARLPSIRSDSAPASLVVAHRVEQGEATGAGAFRLVHRGIGVGHQRVGALAGLVRDRDADARRDPRRFPPSSVSAPRSSSRIRRATAAASASVDGVEQDDELVATDAGHHVAGTDRGPDPPAAPDQELVAGGVPEGVVDVLEAVEIEEQHGHRPVPPAQIGDRPSEVLQEDPPHGQVGQRVVHGQLGELMLGLARGVPILGHHQIGHGESGERRRGAQLVVVELPRLRPVDVEDAPAPSPGLQGDGGDGAQADLARQFLERRPLALDGQVADVQHLAADVGVPARSCLQDLLQSFELIDRATGRVGDPHELLVDRRHDAGAVDAEHVERAPRKLRQDLVRGEIVAQCGTEVVDRRCEPDLFAHATVVRSPKGERREKLVVKTAGCSAPTKSLDVRSHQSARRASRPAGGSTVRELARRRGWLLLCGYSRIMAPVPGPGRGTRERHGRFDLVGIAVAPRSHHGRRRMAGPPSAERRRPASAAGAAAESKHSATLTPRTATADRVAKSVCPYCAVGCGQKIYVKDEKVVQIEGDPDSPISRGRLCPKGSASLDLVTGPQRQTHVLYRRPYGTEWEPLDLDTRDGHDRRPGPRRAPQGLAGHRRGRPPARTGPWASRASAGRPSTTKRTT